MNIVKGTCLTSMVFCSTWS